MEQDDQRPLESELVKLERLARDMAAGAVLKEWTSYFDVAEPKQRGIIADDGLRNGLRKLEDGPNKKKWTEKDINYYSVPLLTSLGYLERGERGDPRMVEGYRGTFEIRSFQITQKAFDLLSKPKTPPPVFISYKRSESSAFALYIESRLKRVGVQNPFIDKDIHIGDEWESVIEERVRGAEYFVCLIGNGTLNSKWVKKEITWAHKAGCKIMSVLHNGVSNEPKDESDDEAKTIAEQLEKLELHKWQLRRVQEESALEYETAANFLLSAMGYPTN